MEPIATPLPQQIPKVISTSMGSVFGSQVQGFPIPLPSPGIDTSQVKQVAASTPQPSIDIILSLQSEITELRGQVERMNLSIEKLLNPPIKPEEPHIDLRFLPNSPAIPNPIAAAPVKKGRGRPKKVVA